MQQESQSSQGGGLAGGTQGKAVTKAGVDKSATKSFTQASTTLHQHNNSSTNDAGDLQQQKMASADQARPGNAGHSVGLSNYPQTNPSLSNQGRQNIQQHNTLSNMKMKGGFSTSRNNNNGGGQTTAAAGPQATDPMVGTLQNQRAASKGQRGPVAIASSGNRFNNNSMIAQGSNNQAGLTGAPSASKNPDSILSISNQISKVRLSPKNQQLASGHAVFRNQKQQQSQQNSSNLLNSTQQPHSNRTSGGFAVHKNGGQSANPAPEGGQGKRTQANAHQAQGDPKLGLKSKANSRGQNQASNFDGDDQQPLSYEQEGGGLGSSRERPEQLLEAQTQLEMENMDTVTIFWFVQQLARIRETNRSLRSGATGTPDARRSLDPHQVMDLLPYPACSDEVILATELDLPNQRVVKADAERTRRSEMRGLYDYAKTNGLKTFSGEEQIVRTEKVLTFYTLQSQTSYKQGYNELLGPFLWLAHKDKLLHKDQHASDVEENLMANPLTASFHTAQLLVDTFLPTLFLDDDFICLQSCFCLLRLLLKYHDPAVCNVLSSAQVTPELYAMTWFFTLFATKCERVDIALDLWSRLVQDKNDENFDGKYCGSGQWGKRRSVFTLSIALILMNREQILSCDRSDLPGLMTKLSLKSTAQVDTLLRLAEDIYEQTPISFWESEEMNILFGENAQEHYKKQLSLQDRIQLHLRLEKYQCVPITNSEFFKNIYPDFSEHTDDLPVVKAPHVGPPRYSCANPKCFRFHQIQQQIQQEQERREKQLQSVDESSEAVSANQQHYMQKYAKHLTNACQEIFAPYSSDSNFNFGRDFAQDQQLQGNAPALVEQMSQTLQQGPLLIGKLAAAGDGPAPDWVVLSNDNSNETGPSQSICAKFESLGIDLKSIDANTRFPDGPSFAELCDDCKTTRFSQLSVDSEKQQNANLRLIIIDCRALMLQKEAMLPGSAQFEITNSCDKRSLLNQVRQRFDGCKDQVHICLLGLNKQEVPRDYQEAQDTIGFSHFGQSPLSSKTPGAAANADSNMNIKEFHDKVLKFIIEMFYRENFKYISFLPGGFEQCHKFIKEENALILHTFIERQIEHETAMRLEKIVAESTKQQPHFFELVDPHYNGNCYHCATEASEVVIESKAETTKASQQSGVSISTPSGSQNTGVRRGLNTSGKQSEAADVESNTNSSGIQKQGSSAKDLQDSKANSNSIMGGQVKATNMSRFTQHLSNAQQRFGRGNQQPRGAANTFEMQRSDQKQAQDSGSNMNKYDLKVFKIRSSYTPAGYNSNQKQAQPFGVANSEYDSNGVSEEERDNRNGHPHQHHQQHEGFDIFSGFRSWWHTYVHTHINGANNSKMGGGLSLPDQHHHNTNNLAATHQGSQMNDASYGRGNASSPTAVDPKSGLQARNNKGEPMHLQNVTQLTRSNLRSKHSNKGKQVRGPNPSGAQNNADGDFNRDGAGAHVAADGNNGAQASVEYLDYIHKLVDQQNSQGKVESIRSNTKEIVPKSNHVQLHTGNAGQQSQNFSNQNSNRLIEGGSNNANRGWDGRASNISDQQRQTNSRMRPLIETNKSGQHQQLLNAQGRLLNKPAKNESHSQARRKGQVLQQHLNSNNYQSFDNNNVDAFQNNYAESTQQYVSFQDHSFGQGHQRQKVSGPRGQELPLQIHAISSKHSPSPRAQNRMVDYRTSLHGNSATHGQPLVGMVHQPGLAQPSTIAHQQHAASMRPARQQGKASFMPSGPGTASRTHYQHHKSERKQQSFFEDFENANEDEDEQQQVRPGYKEYGADHLGENVVVGAQDVYRGDRRDGEERSFGFNERQNTVLMLGGSSKRSGIGQSEGTAATGRALRDKAGNQALNRQQEDRTPWNRGGIQGRHPSASNDNENLDRVMGRATAADRGQSAVAIGDRARMGGTERTHGEVDRLSSDQKLAHKSIGKNDKSNPKKINNFVDQSGGGKASERLRKQKEDLKNAVVESLPGRANAEKDSKRGSQKSKPNAKGGPNAGIAITIQADNTSSNLDSNAGASIRSKGAGSSTASASQAASQFQLEERSYYLCNGIQKQQSYEGWHDVVQRIVEVDAKQAPNDIVIYHVKRLASSHLQQLIQHQQMAQTSQTQSQQASTGQQVSTRIFGHDSKNPNITSIIITQFTTVCLCQAYSFIQSRFFMHDLIKITSRKSSAKIITFYFRIPQFGEYNSNYYRLVEAQPLQGENGAMGDNLGMGQDGAGAPDATGDNVILSTYNQNPCIPYQFAYKRKKYQEVKMGFEFKTEEEARDCIERVSILYKRLKNSYKEDTANAAAQAQATPLGGAQTGTISGADAIDTPAASQVMQEGHDSSLAMEGAAFAKPSAQPQDQIAKQQNF